MLISINWRCVLVRLIEIAPELWLEKYRDSEAALFGITPNLSSNIFNSLQLMGREVFKRDLKAWALVDEDHEVGWIAACYNSLSTVRFRGIVIREGKRNFGYGKKMILLVMDQFPEINHFILFCSLGMIGYYQRIGFSIVHEFVPRPLEVYSAKDASYTVKCPDLLALMEFRR
jgi:hypothetical protein